MQDNSEVQQVIPENEEPASPEDVAQVEKLEAQAVEEEKRLDRMLREDKEGRAREQDETAMAELEKKLDLA